MFKSFAAATLAVAAQAANTYTFTGAVTADAESTTGGKTITNTYKAAPVQATKYVTTTVTVSSKMSTAWVAAAGEISEFALCHTSLTASKVDCCSFTTANAADSKLRSADFWCIQGIAAPTFVSSATLQSKLTGGTVCNKQNVDKTWTVAANSVTSGACAAGVITLKSYTDDKTNGVVTWEEKFTEADEATAKTKLTSVEGTWGKVWVAAYYKDQSATGFKITFKT